MGVKGVTMVYSCLFPWFAVAWESVLGAFMDLHGPSHLTFGAKLGPFQSGVLHGLILEPGF